MKSTLIHLTPKVLFLPVGLGEWENKNNNKNKYDNFKCENDKKTTEEE